MAKQGLLSITPKEKATERLHFHQPIPKGTVMRLRRPDAPNMRKYEAIYQGCGLNYATGRFGIPVRMHWLSSSDPRGQSRTIEDRSLWLLYDVTPWCRPESGCDPDEFYERVLFTPDHAETTTAQKEKKPMIPRFEIETHLPQNTIIHPRRANTHPVLFVKAIDTGNGAFIYIVRTRVSDPSEPIERWGRERGITHGALISGYDLTPWGYVTVDVRKAARRAEKGQTIIAMETQIAALTARLTELEGRK